MADIKALIAKQRAELEVVKQATVPVAVGGELVTLVFDRCTSDEWDDLVGANPPRHGRESDATVGYNVKAVSAGYPHVLVDDERLDAETWAEMFDVLDQPHKNNIGVVLWGLNVNETLRELRELGKGRAGKK
jgi:hypothetical protein